MQPDDPMRFIYPGMIDLAIDEQPLDVEDILFQMQSLTLANVQEKFPYVEIRDTLHPDP